MKPTLITFGDPLPKGKKTDHFISYSIDSFPGGMLAGPYPDHQTASGELDDILYEGVTNVKIVSREELTLEGLHAG